LIINKYYTLAPLDVAFAVAYSIFTHHGYTLHVFVSILLF